ncbi:MAG: hypothetical protein RR681_09715 [Lachnospiraceae bacterium]
MEPVYWNEFTQSGKVDDYLYYRGVETCRQIVRKYDQEETGRGKVESINHSNRDSAVRNTNRGI